MSGRSITGINSRKNVEKRNDDPNNNDSVDRDEKRLGLSQFLATVSPSHFREIWFHNRRCVNNNIPFLRRLRRRRRR